MTTKYPLAVVLMELAHQLALRKAVLRASWLPRLQNEEADALTNLDFRHFDLSKRIPVNLDDLKFGVLNELMPEGERFYQEVDELRAQERARRTAIGSGKLLRRKKRAGDTLREREPW